MSARTTLRLALAVAAVLAAARPGSAQSLAERVRQAPDGTVRLDFEAREGVCGTTRGGVTVTRDRDDRLRRGAWRGDEECIEGPVRLALRVRDGRVTRLEARVGHPAPSLGGRDTHLGTVEPQAAADFLLDLAERAEPDAAEDAVFPATIARDVVVWPRLARLARSQHASDDARKQAVFWLGQEAAEAATAELGELVESEDSEVRKQVVFALSQRPNGEGIPVLLRVARTHRDPAVRKAALFWLGQSGDPRAIALFEEILKG